MRKVIVEG